MILANIVLKVKIILENSRFSNVIAILALLACVNITLFVNAQSKMLNLLSRNNCESFILFLDNGEGGILFLKQVSYLISRILSLKCTYFLITFHKIPWIHLSITGGEDFTPNRVAYPYTWRKK